MVRQKEAPADALSPGRMTKREVAERCGCSEKTVSFWLGRGLAVGGRRVRLRSTKIGKHRYITEADLSAFVAAQNPDQQPVSVPGPTPSQTRRRARSVKDKLNGLGVKTREDP